MYHCLLDEPTPSLSRFTGCLLGGALGDALGHPLEFLTATAILDRCGSRTPASLALGGPSPARITDDTQMTLFTAEALIRDRARLEQGSPGDVVTGMHRALLRWYHTQEPAWQPPDPSLLSGWLVTVPELHVQRAPGRTCLTALRTGERNTSKGCGAVMRVAPIGLAAGDPAWAFEVASEAGAITHHHPSGYLSAAYLAALICGLGCGQTLPDAMADAENLLRQAPGHEETLAAIRAARLLAEAGPPGVLAIEGLGGGWVGEEALAIALACTLSADLSSPAGVADALWRAVAHGGDSDSTGAIAGNLIGVLVGEEGLPPNWLADLELQAVITRVAGDLYTATVHGTFPDPHAYPAG